MYQNEDDCAEDLLIASDSDTTILSVVLVIFSTQQILGLLHGNIDSDPLVVIRALDVFGGDA